MTGLSHYPVLLSEIKNQFQTAQARAVLVVNGELICWNRRIGRLPDQRQASGGWVKLMVQLFSHVSGAVC